MKDHKLIVKLMNICRPGDYIEPDLPRGEVEVWNWTAKCYMKFSPGVVVPGQAVCLHI